MARELKHIDITNRPELLQLVEEARTANEPLVLRRENEDVAILRLVKRPAKPRLPRGKPFSMTDPLWNLAGAGASGLGDVAGNKHKYLAEAYLSHIRKVGVHQPVKGTLWPPDRRRTRRPRESAVGTASFSASARSTGPGSNGKGCCVVGGYPLPR